VRLNDWSVVSLENQDILIKRTITEPFSFKMNHARMNSSKSDQ